MSAAAPKNVARFLEWDTQFFGVRIASLEAEGLDEAHWRGALDSCRAQRVQCLYVLCASLADAELPLAAGARRTDLRVTYVRARLDAPPAGQRVRAALEADIPALRALAARSHGDSRFYADGRFARERCDELYATWIEKSVRGWADAVFVAGPPGAPLGYLSFHARADHAEIGLVAVAEEARGQGLGRELVEAALRRAAAAGQRTEVVTQGRNEAAAALYERCGFERQRVQFWLHHWFDSRP